MKVMVMEIIAEDMEINLEKMVGLDKVVFKIKDLVVIAVINSVFNKVLVEDSINNLEIKVLGIIHMEEIKADLITLVIKIIKECHLV